MIESTAISNDSNGTDDHLLMEEGMSISPSMSHNQIAASLPPQWVDDVDGINELLSDVTRMMGILGSMHASRVGTVFGRDLDDMEKKIERMTNDITGMYTLLSKEARLS